MKIYFLAKCLLLALLTAKICVSQTLTIDSCYAITQRNYPLIKQYELIEQSKEFTISNANKAYLPQLNLTGIGGFVFGMPVIGSPGSASESNNPKFIGVGQFNQLIWDGGATKSHKDVATFQSAVERANIDVQMYALRDRINQLYFGILLVDEQIKQIDIQIEMLNRNVNRISLMHNNGYALRTELNELKAEVLKVKQHRTEFEFTRKSYLNMLSIFMNTELSDSVRLLKPLSTQSAETKNNRPELLLYENQRNLIDAESSINNVNLMPKIGILGAGALITPGINFGSDNLSSVALAGLSISWNIGGLYTRSSNKNLTGVNLDKIRTQEETFLFNNKIEVTQTNAEIEKYRTILLSDNEIVDLRKNICESYQLQYDNGSCSLYELINAADKETEARTNQALHDVQMMLAIYQLKSNTGNYTILK
jgi:outer membrane protein TolC